MTELILRGKTADVKSTVREALRYLKEYRSKQDTIAEQLAEIEQKNDHVCELAKTVCEEYDRLCNRLAEEYSNDALSWDELKQMEGKPVWVEVDEKYKGWIIVGKFYSLFENEDLDAHVDLYYFDRTMEYSKETYGYYWQAYRKENV